MKKNKILIIIITLIVCMLVLIGVIYYIKVKDYKEIAEVGQNKEQLTSTDNFISTKDHLAQMQQISSAPGIKVLTTDDLSFSFVSKNGTKSTYSISDWTLTLKITNRRNWQLCC